MRIASLLGLMGATVGFTMAAPAWAEGVPECGGLRFEGLSNCEVQVSAGCTAGCSKLGVYQVRCATKLVKVCDSQCTVTADSGCSGTCNTQCKSDCDNGVNVICAMNCFDECAVGRDAKCNGAADAGQCKATWDANCDSKCDSKCVTVDGGCYSHCIECCDGSCTASANIDCQTTCQDKQFKTCENEFQADCSASCSADGALFCDGVFVISGSQIPACISALATRGLTVNVEANISLGADGLKGDIAAGLCTYSPARAAGLAAPAFALAAATALAARRRRRSGSASR